MQQAFNTLYKNMIESVAGNEPKQQEGKRAFLSAVKEAFRQLLKVSLLLHACSEADTQD